METYMIRERVVRDFLAGDRYLEDHLSEFQAECPRLLPMLEQQGCGDTSLYAALTSSVSEFETLMAGRAADNVDTELLRNWACLHEPKRNFLTVTRPVWDAWQSDGSLSADAFIG